MQGTPSFAPTTLLALLPAAYAWQVHGWLVGILIFWLAALAVNLLGWASIMQGWSPRRLMFARTALIISIMVLVGLSAAEICDIQTGVCK